MVPVQHADLRQRAAVAPPLLDPIVAVAPTQLARPQARAGTRAKLEFRELAFDGYAPVRSSEHHVDAGGPRLSERRHIVFEFERPMIFTGEERWPPTFRSDACEQVEAAGGADSPEDALC
jgi:hypothetical protein